MEEKICKYCQKAIDSKAYKCPYCQEWLTKTALTWKNPYIWNLIPISFYLGAYFFFQYYWRAKFVDSYMFKSPIAYSKESKLKLLNDRLIKNKNSIRIISEIENLEPFTWNSVTTKTVYFDKLDNPIYLNSNYVPDLRPGEKRLIQTDARISDEPELLKDFDHFEVIIESADATPWKK